MGRKFLLSVLVAAVLSAVPAHAETLLSIDHLRPGQLEMSGFELKKGGEIEIEAVGARTRYSDNLITYAWILDNKTRQPVWVMKGTRTDSFSESKLLRYAEKVTFLEAGKYELYMYAGTDLTSGINLNLSGSKDFLDFLGELFDNDDYDEQPYRDMLRDCYVRITSKELKRSDIDLFNITGDIPGALVRYNRLGDDQFVRQEFSLDEPMNIRIYSLIEYPRGWDHPVDYGWIVNADTRKKVWEMDRFNTERAGGGRKNRVFDDEVRLDAGSYILYYATDDSHSYDDFNVPPPNDPANWGVTLLPGVDFKASKFHLVDETERPEPLIDFTRARDDDYFEQPFQLKKASSLYIHALGEYSDGDRDFVDYGWIEDAASGETVWEMSRSNTESAGGADKNRMFDGYVELPEGKYIAYYITDDSHSYRDWNAARPYDPEAWGMAISPGPKFKASDFALLSDDQVMALSDILTRLTRVRDRERRRGTFHLDRQTRVHIYAIGEYSERDRQFVDYGWIEDAGTGHTVWEMTRRNTSHAGGADKNRKYDDSVTLEPGDYVVYYITDGSHSFGDWNASRPDDPINWGITVRREDGSRARR